MAVLFPNVVPHSLTWNDYPLTLINPWNFPSSNLRSIFTDHNATIIIQSAYCNNKEMRHAALLILYKLFDFAIADAMTILKKNGLLNQIRRILSFADYEAINAAFMILTHITYENAEYNVQMVQNEDYWCLLTNLAQVAEDNDTLKSFFIILANIAVDSCDCEHFWRYLHAIKNACGYLGVIFYVKWITCHNARLTSQSINDDSDVEMTDIQHNELKHLELLITYAKSLSVIITNMTPTTTSQTKLTNTFMKMLLNVGHVPNVKIWQSVYEGLVAKLPLMSFTRLQKYWQVIFVPFLDDWTLRARIPSLRMIKETARALTNTTDLTHKLPLLTLQGMLVDMPANIEDRADSSRCAEIYLSLILDILDVYFNTTKIYDKLCVDFVIECTRTRFNHVQMMATMLLIEMIIAPNGVTLRVNMQNDVFNALCDKLHDNGDELDSLIDLALEQLMFGEDSDE